MTQLNSVFIHLDKSCSEPKAQRRGIEQWLMFRSAERKSFSSLSTGVEMNRSRSSWNKKDPQSTVTRITRSSSSQVRHPDSAETLQSGPGLYGKQRKKQTDSALAQDLSQMSVSGLAGSPTGWGHATGAVVSFCYNLFFWINVWMMKERGR